MTGGRGLSAVLLAAVAAASGCAAPSAPGAGSEPRGNAAATASSTAEPPGFVVLDGSQAAGVPAGPLPEQTSTFFGPDEAPVQLLAAQSRFPEKLPDGVSWARVPYAEPEDNAAIEDGVFDVAVAEYWLCAWTNEYLSAVDAGDRQHAGGALTELDKHASLPAIAAHHSNPEVFVARILEPARRGDAAMVREFSATCSSY